MDVAKFLKRFGVGGAGAVVGALLGYLPQFADPANLVEFGALAGVVGALFGVVIPLLEQLYAKLQALV